MDNLNTTLTPLSNEYILVNSHLYTGALTPGKLEVELKGTKRPTYKAQSRNGQPLGVTLYGSNTPIQKQGLVEHHFRDVRNPHITLQPGIDKHGRVIDHLIIVDNSYLIRKSELANLTTQGTAQELLTLANKAYTLPGYKAGEFLVIDSPTVIVKTLSTAINLGFTHIRVLTEDTNKLVEYSNSGSNVRCLLKINNLTYVIDQQANYKQLPLVGKKLYDFLGV